MICSCSLVLETPVLAMDHIAMLGGASASTASDTIARVVSCNTAAVLPFADSPYMAGEMSDACFEKDGVSFEASSHTFTKALSRPKAF